MQSLLQILKLNEARKGNKNGRDWEMQDAECLLLNDDGTIGQVGVLMIPKDLRGKVTAGTFIGSFALRASLTDRRIEAVIVDLKPYAKPAQPPAPARS